MSEQSRRFNFDDFDEQIREALDPTTDSQPTTDPHPDELGGVVVSHLFREWSGIDMYDGPDDAA